MVARDQVGATAGDCAGADPPDSTPETELRVLHVVEAFGGGVFEVIRELVARLPHHGVRSAIAYGVRSETPSEVRSLVHSDVEVFALPWNGRSARVQLSARKALRGTVARWNPDVVHLHSSFAGLVGATAVDRSIPTIYTPHGYSFLMTDKSRVAIKAFKVLERVVAARVWSVGAVSEHEACLARNVAGAANVFVVRNGIPELDRPLNPVLRKSQLRPLVIAMGRIAPARRPDEAASILRDVSDCAEVRWVGGGSEPGASAPVLRQGVPVTGWMSREEASAHLRSASVYLHWAAWDGLPLSVLEAMAYNVPVVGSDIGPLRELLPPEQICATPEQAAHLVRALVKDPARRERALRAQDLIRHHHSAADMALGWADAYARLAGRRLVHAHTA